MTAREVRLVVRPEGPGGLAGRLKARLLPGTDYAFETPEGERRALLRIHVTRPNEVVLEPDGERVTLTREGFLVPRFEARRAPQRNGAAVEPFAAVEYELVTGNMDLVLPDGTRRRLDQRGLLLPVVRLVEPDGAVPMEIEAWRLYGAEFHVTLRPDDSRWSERDLLAVAALVFHARQSIAIVLSAALGAGVLAPAKASA